jgi:hypothetical protein
MRLTVDAGCSAIDLPIPALCKTNFSSAAPLRLYGLRRFKWKNKSLSRNLASVMTLNGIRIKNSELGRDRHAVRQLAQQFAPLRRCVNIL